MTPQASLPLVLCGPIVRRVSDRGASIFLVLRAPRQVTLTVFDDKGAAAATGRRDTVALGKDLHIVLLSASGSLQWGATYQYGLSFSADSGKTSADLGAPGVLTQKGGDLSDITIPGQARPGFVLPPRELSRLRILHTSCRKPHGDGEDALSYAETALTESLAAGAKQLRPQQLFMTGDQVYADDVSPALLGALRSFAQKHIDPADQEERTELSAHAAQLAPGQRQLLVQNTGKMTSGEAQSHLITLGEFYAAYLFAWSPVVWPEALQKDPQLQSFAQTLPKVRRVLANIATYMIFDDHEITDDWYIRAPWCEATLGNALGRRIIRNGLAAYALFQHWGNDPSEYEGDRPGAKLLTAIAGWDGTKGKAAQIEQHAYVPRAGQNLDSAGPQALRWSWRWQGPDYEVLAMDSRTRRRFDGKSASLVSVPDIDAMFATPRQGSLTILLAPAPILGERVLEGVQSAAQACGQTYKVDAEAWGHSPTYEHLIVRLMERSPVIALSGDVHYGYGAVLRDRKNGRTVVNYVSSAAKNMSGTMARLFLYSLGGSGSLGEQVALPAGALAAAGIPEVREITTRAGVFEEQIIDTAAPAAAPLGPIGSPLKTQRKRAPIVSRSHLGELRFDGEDLVQVLWYKGNDPHDVDRDTQPNGFRLRSYPARLKPAAR